MFSKFAVLLALVPFVTPLTIDPLTDAHSQGQVTIRWAITSNDDPDLATIELANVIFRNVFALRPSVDTSLEEFTITLPVVPAGDGYTLQLVNIGNVTDVYAESASFSIAPPLPDNTTTSATGASTGSSTTAGTSTTPLTTGTGTTTRTGTRTGTGTGTSGAASETESQVGSFNGNDNGAVSTRGSIVGALAVAAALAVSAF